MNAQSYQNTSLNQAFIRQRADPFITRSHSGMYYFAATVPAYDCIILRGSSTLEGLRTAEERVIWRKHERGAMSCHIWAPELHYLQGAWYIYFAAGEAEDIWKIRPYALRCRGQDPLHGTWEEMGMVTPADDFSFTDFSLDMTVFEHRQRVYAVWAEKVNVGKKISNLYIGEMSSPTALKTPQMLLSSPTYAWERVDFWVNEGPAILKGKRHLFLTYSASATGDCYCMGMLSARLNADPLDPNSWVKAKEPVLRSDRIAGLYGPGHNSFFTNERQELIMAYHARTYDEIIGDPLGDPNRHTYLMRVVWEDDMPLFKYTNQLTFPMT